MTWRAGARILAGCLALAGVTGAQPGGMDMAERAQLARNWVEVSEEGGRIVLRPKDWPVPRSRGGRRHLELMVSGNVRGLAAGPTDALETQGQGGWSLAGDTLTLELEGWQGRYQIEQLADDILVLRRR